MSVVVLRGDGIGPVVVDEALRVLAAVGYRPPLREMPFGVSAYDEHADTLPSSTERALRESGVGLLGAGGTARGASQPSSILRLRRALGLELLVRPVWLDGKRVTLIGHAWDGLYQRHDEVDGDDVVHTRVLTREGTTSLLRKAASVAKTRVTFVDKPSVFHRSQELIERCRDEVDTGGASFELVNADAFVASFLRSPSEYDVVVAYSFVGDVISDLMAAVAGGVGLAASVSLGAGVAVFEPVHGTAPRRAADSPQRVSPVGAVRAAALLLEHVGEGERAKRVHAALASADLPRTPDQGGAATTTEVGDFLVQRVERSAR